MTLGQVTQEVNMTSRENQHIETWSIYNAFALVIATIISLVFSHLDVLFFVFAVSITALIYLNRKALLKMRPVFGIANTITLIRLIIIILGFLFAANSDTFLLFCFLSFAVSLDFFDGLAARYFKESSFLGQYFDMEIDAFFVLIMCCFYFLFQGISWWILIPGLLRYLFRIYTFLFPKPDYRESKKKYATIIAASYFIVLLLGLITQNNVQFFILFTGSLVLVSSFLISIIEFHKA